MSSFATQTPLVLPKEPKDAVAYLHTLLQELSLKFSQLERELTVVLYAAPAKPREGRFAFADGTTWNPGSGRGLYQYVSGAWVKL